MQGERRRARRAATSGEVVVVHQATRSHRYPTPMRVNPAAARSYPVSPMRIVSLVPSATEMLFALGLGDEVTAVTHECDHPPQALELPKVTRDVIGPGLATGRDRPRGARADRAGPRDLRARRGGAARRSQPDLIVTQALCAVCAVSYEDVKAVAERLDSAPAGDLARPAHARRGARRRAHARRGHRRARTPASTWSRTPRRGSTACGSRCAPRAGAASPRSSGSTRSSSPATGRRS